MSDLIAEKFRKYEATIEAQAATIEKLEGALKDPNAVHVNLLRGTIARPTIRQIIHIYGEEPLRQALANMEKSNGTT